MENNDKGVLYMVISATAFSLGGLFIKLIPWGSIATASGRSIFSSLFVLLAFILLKKKIIINKTTIIGAVLVALNMITFVLANKLTTAANTIILEYTAPIYIILFGLLFKKQKPSKLQIITVVCILFGMVLVLASSLGRGGMLGNIIAIINGVIYAFVIMLNDFEGGDCLSSVLMGHSFTAIVGIPFILQETNFSSSVLLYIAILGIFQAGLGYFMFALGTKYCDPLTASLICYIEPILNPILVLLFYKERIGLLSLIGIVVVLVSIIRYTLHQKN